MAFLNERNIAIGNALERAYFEVVNAREAKAQTMDEKTMLWHIYKAQKALKEAAARLVEDKQAEDSSVCHCDQAIDSAEQAIDDDFPHHKLDPNYRTLKAINQAMRDDEVKALRESHEAIDSCEQQHKNSTAKLLEGLSSEQKAMVLTDVIIRTLRGETDNER